MKKVIYIIIVVIVIVLALLGLLFLNSSKKTETTDNNETRFYNFKENETKKIKICKSKDCEYGEDIFLTMRLNINNSELQSVVDSINRETDDYYNKVLKSDLSSSKCSAVRNKYKHSMYVDTIISNYRNDNYISIAVSRIIVDVCTEKTTNTKTKSYIYDVKDKKLITQDEFIEKEDIKEEDIRKAIEENLKELKIESKEDSIFDDYVLHYTYDGELYASYKANDYYYEALLKQKA